jgi:hypothetical protein
MLSWYGEKLRCSTCVSMVAILPTVRLIDRQPWKSDEAVVGDRHGQATTLLGQPLSFETVVYCCSS